MVNFYFGIHMLFKSFLIISLSLFSIHTFAHNYSSCQNIKLKLQHQLEYYKKHDNQKRIHSLQKTLARVGQKCAHIKLKNN